MTTDPSVPTIALVWSHSDITSAVIEMARSTGSRAIFDLTGADLDAVSRALVLADATADAVELKLPASLLASDKIEGFLREANLARVWVELHPGLIEGNLEWLLGRMAELSTDVTMMPIVGDVELISRILRGHLAFRNLALKGSEASGFVSSETIFTLYATVREIVSGWLEPPSLFVWGGIGTAEAAAAFLSAGAKGVVFESIHWLTDLVQIDEDVRRKLAALRPDHTDLVGLNLQVPCRLFNKGNSKAVKDLKEFAGSLCGAEIRDEQRKFFGKRILKEAVPALHSTFGRDELIPLGVEAGFADSFAKRYGSSTDEAMDRFIREIANGCEKATSRLDAFVNSPTAQEFGTAYPFIQGAMSWITDVPQFSRTVAEAGGLPSVALGLMDRKMIDEKLGGIQEVMGDLPYAVNVITLTENPNRDAQLAWIREIRPRFAVIAAGEPAHARHLIEDGIEAIYIAPNEELLKMALAVGVRCVICEGHEAGGHVGQHSTLTLAQMVLELKHREPSLFTNAKVILAGGVFNRETAFMAAMLGADAIQMGTVYLTTKEIVETGALQQAYQRMILDAPFGGTVVTGETTGLRVRSVKSPTIEAICTLERDFSAGSESEASFRRRIEELAAGSLLIAARGIEPLTGTKLDEAICIERGQFMSGACAGALTQVRTIAEVHRTLAEGVLASGLPFLGPLRRGIEPADAVAWASAADKRPRVAARRAGHPTDGAERIAITGMSVVNSLGNSPEEVWSASLAMRSGIIEVPKSRWDHDIFYHPRPRTPEKTYCRVGAFQNIELTRKDIGVAPQDFRTMTDSTKLTLWLAGNALSESGLLDSDVPRERIAVLISQNSGEAAATLQDVIIRGAVTNIVSAVKRVLPLTPDVEHAVEEEIKAGRIVIDDTTLLGRLNCTAGGFICNRYGFMGPSFSVSAACATALVALYSAYQMMRNGIIDAAVVGGAEEFLTPMHFLEFSALGALAGMSGADWAPFEYSRPFDSDRDGMVLGEGGGLIVIERESVARKRGARAHAYITSMGASNNHLGMVESSRTTQEIAIRASFADSSYGPEGVDLVECHATSTRQGDVEEVQALKKFFPSDKVTALTSFKSQIGHTLGASGVNSLIRGVTAMKAGVCPATLNYRKPDPDIGIEGSGLIVFTEPTAWERRNGKPRRFQVNAFGFGGSNYVVQVEESEDGVDPLFAQLPGPALETAEVIPVAGPPEGISFFRTEISGAKYRVAVVSDIETDAVALIENSEPMANGGALAPKRLKALSRQGIHLGLDQGTPPPLAFVFPGQGSHYAGMGHELYQTFPIVREWMDRAAAVAEFDLLQRLFHDSEEDLQKTRWQQPALFTLEYSMVRYLLSLGIKPTAMAGHSLGELTALCLAGVYSFEDGFRLVNKRAVCMDKACIENVDPGVMMAVDAPRDVIEEKLRTAKEVHITNLNSPHQIVLGGNTEEVQALGTELKEMGYRRKLLRVSMAFHSPIMRCIHEELEEFVAGIEFHPPEIPVVSNTTTKPFPEDPDEIKRIVMAHLESPVLWMENVKSLWNEFGVRLFVEVGPRDILTNLITDTVEDADCIQTLLPSAEVTMYKTAVAQLYARGHLRTRTSARFVSFPKSPKPAEPVPVSGLTEAVTALPAGRRAVELIVQQEINGFILESFGRFLRPGLLAAIRREHDPAFTEDDLNRLLAQMYRGVSVLPTVTPAPASAAFVAPPSPVSPVSRAAPLAPARPPAVMEGIEVPQPEEEQPKDITENIIRIIMEATGYERDEIEADMDLREDLAIRSSRLPIIMDAMETQFGIKIELEDFMDVRTIRDIATRIGELIGKDSVQSAAKKPEVGQEQAIVADIVESRVESRPIKRVVFRELPLALGDGQPVELNVLDSVAIFSATAGAGLRREVGAVLRRDYGSTILPMTLLDSKASDGGEAFDVRTEAGATEAAQKLREAEALAGLVLVVDEGIEQRVTSMEAAGAVLTGCFALLQAFLESSSKKFAICLHKSRLSDGMDRILTEGITGMFLSAAHEFSSVRFRSVKLDAETDLRDAVRGAMDRSQKILETIYRQGELRTRRGVVESARFGASEPLKLGKGDVVLFAGGAYGITPSLAMSLAAFGSTLVFLGRTPLDLAEELEPFVDASEPPTEAAKRFVAAAKASASATDRESEVARISRTIEILRTLKSLKRAEVEAAYYCCDVTNAERLKSTVAQIVTRFKKIDGVVHAAGILRDSFIRQMTMEDFAAVVNVKAVGAWNLSQATEDHGLRFMVCLSSAAAIQGNPGQTNYAAGNRMMAELMAILGEQKKGIRFKALVLPPIEGAGMAEDPEIRALMKRMNADYVHADELAALFCRELFVAPAEDAWVMFMRSLPDVSAVSLETDDPPADPDAVQTAAMKFHRHEFPMIDSVPVIDLATGQLEARRRFSQERDLWISDHRPFKFMKHPIVSAIMAVETFLEAAKMLFPHLNAVGIRDAQFQDILECPPGRERESEIHCRKVDTTDPYVTVEVWLGTRGISPSGRIMERVSVNYKAVVLLSAPGQVRIEEHAGFPVALTELDTRPMPHEEVLTWYQDRSNMLGRYRVIEDLDGTAPGAIRGRTIYREIGDFAAGGLPEYQYSPYLLEALMQAVNFYIVMRNQEEQRAMIPYGIGELIFTRRCANGEQITLEGRLRRETDEGLDWDARGLDQNGRVVIYARNLMMRWFPKRTIGPTA